MSTITGTSILNKAATLLFDNNNIKWSRAELLMWLCDGQRAIVSILPEASSTRAVVQLVAGPRQAIPAGGWMLLDVIGNMGTDGVTRGSSIKRVDGRIFDETNAGWLDAPSMAAVTLAMYNARDPAAWDCYPPSDGTGYVELLYSMSPVDLTTEASTLGVIDLYSPALLDYLMFRCKSKEVDYANNAQEASAYYQSFITYVTGGATQVGRLAAQMGDLKGEPVQQQGSVGDN